uniref:molybdopterin molybdotransferase MoeA n=1 Tax=Blastomonas sp. TaxID=1909299 RepID=UPI003593CB2A
MTAAGGLIPLAEAQARLLALATLRPSIDLPLDQCAGRYLAAPVSAARNQPAADLSAMDGYAIRWADMPGPWRVIGESAAGRPYEMAIGSGEAVRISTGAVMPSGADSVLVQEDCAREDDTLLLTGDGPAAFGAHVRRAGHDFAHGALLAEAGTLIDARLTALAAMAGHGTLPVHPLPSVAILSTGDELVPPGAPLPSPAHIPASNGVM